MSRTIDERVVSMQFDNKHFEQNVRTSLSTLDKLKQSLNLTGSAKGLEQVNSAAKNCNLTPLGNAVESVRVKFSALEVMAVTALANITNSAVNAGKRMANALTLQPIRTGFAEYETQIGAIQTILANTQSKGTTLDDVNAALDELNKYADQTIYNFTEMTRNIGTFTAAGVELDKSVTSIKGIANLAAISGSTSQQASTAMYQLSQALAAGKVQLMDWNSVVNAGMGGQVFQDALKRTATHFGYNVDAMIKKYGSFRESLTQGEWLTAEVLTETLTQLSGAYTEADLIGQGYTKSQAQEIVKLANTAAGAATDVKTFTQLIDTLKESAQSGWTQTWELIVGDFEQAKSLWSNVSEVIGKMINDSAESRNSLLKPALTSKWDQMIEKINEAGVSTNDFEKKVKEIAKAKNINIDGIIKKYGSFEAAFREGGISANILKDAIDALNGSLVDLSKVDRELAKGSRGDDVKAAQTALRKLKYDLGDFGEDGVDGIIGAKTEAAIKAFQEAQGLKVTGIIDDETLAALDKACGSATNLKESVGSLIDEIDELGGRERLLNAFANLWKAITTPIKAAKKAWGEVFEGLKPEQLYSLIEGFETFTSNLIMSEDSAEKLQKVFKGLFSVLEIGASIVGGGLKLGFKAFNELLERFDLNLLDVAAAAGDALTNFRDWAFENGILAKGLDKTIDVIADGIRVVHKWIQTFLEMPEVREKIQAVKDTLLGGWNGLTSFFGNRFDNFTGFIENLQNLDFSSIKSPGELLKSFKEAAGRYLSNIGDTFVNAKNKIVEFFSSIGETIVNCKENIVGFVTLVKDKLGDNFGNFVALGSLLTFILMLVSIKKSLNDATGILGKFADTFSTFKGIGKSVTGVLDEFKGVLTSFKDLNAAKIKNMNLKARTEVLLTIAKAIGILAASLWVISKIPPDDLKRAGITVALMGGLVVGLMWLVNKIAANPVDKFDTTVIQFGLMIKKLAWALLLMSTAIYILGKMDRDTLVQGGNAVGLFLLSMVGMMWATKLMGERDVYQFGKMVKKLSSALLTLTLVAWILGKMDRNTLIQGGAAIGVFLLAMVGMMQATKMIGERDITKFGSMMLQLGLSLLLMTGAITILGKMDTDTMVQGLVGVGAILLMMAGMMKATNLLSKDMPKFGMTMFSLGAALMLMTGAILILGHLDKDTILKGELAIAGMLGMMIAMMAATKLLGRHSYNAGKVGLMILAFSTSIMLLTGSILLLSLLDAKKLAKATIAIAGIGVIFAGLVTATKNAKNIKMGTIIGLSVAIGIMAMSIAALSFIEPKKLLSAAGALAAVIGTCAMLLKSTSHFNSAKSLIGLGGLAVVTLVVKALEQIIIELTRNVTNADDAVKVATALSELILALSASCALLSLVSKFGPKTWKGVGVLAAVMGIVGIAAGIAIWQLPNIATKLSDFMINLEPFVSGVKGIDSGLLTNIKTLGEAINAFASAGAKFALVDLFTFGGVSIAFHKFTNFIKEIIPLIKEVALDVSGDDVKINYDNLNAVIGAIKGLAEAADMVPSVNFGAVASKFGGGGYMSIPLLETFIDFVKEAVPIVKDLAMELSTGKIKINTSNLEAVVGAVGSLAEAADSLPSYSTGIAFGQYGAGWGVAAGISIPGLTTFIQFVKEVVPLMSDLTLDVSKTDITSKDAENIGSICEAVGYLAEAADKVPTTDVAVGFAKFAGGFGFGTYVGIPGLLEFVGFVNNVVPIMSDFTIDISKSSITEEDAKNLGTICEAIGYLGDAAGKAPGIQAAIGFAKFALGFGGGAAFTIPQLEKFISFVKEVVPVMKDFTIDIGESNMTESDAENLKSMCEAVKYLGEAADLAPGPTVGAMLASIGPAIAGGLYITSTDLDSFTEWIKEIIPVMSGLTLDVKAANLTAEDGQNLNSICAAVKVLAEAAKAAPQDTEYAGVFGTYVSTTNLTDFTAWVTGVVPVMQQISTDISTAISGDSPIITDEGVKTVQAICNSVKILADAAALAPKQEAYSNIFGTWVTTTDLTGFTDWISEVITILQDLGSKLSESDVEVDTATLQGIAKAAAQLGESAYWFTSALNFNMWIDIETAKQYIKDITGLIDGFAKDMASIDVASAESGASAAKKLTEVLQNLSGFTYSTVDTTAFGTKIGEIAAKIDSFARDMAGVDLSTATTQVATLEGICTSLSEIKVDGVDGLTDSVKNLTTLDFGRLDSLGDSLSKIAETSVDDFIAGFNNAGPELANAGITMMSNLLAGVTGGASAVVSIFTGMVSKMTTAIKNKYSQFKTLGKNMVQGFADGISANTFRAEAKAAAMAQKAYEAAKEALDVNSPSKIFRSLGYTVPEGFSMGIDKMGGMVKESAVNMTQTAINGTKNAIARIADAVNSDIDTQPTIRPVVDLSGVEYGARAIDGMFHMSPSMGVLTNVGTISRSMNRIQNGPNDDVISAINDLSNKLGNISGNTYNVNGITYDDGTNVSTAVGELVRAIRVERRK